MVTICKCVLSLLFFRVLLVLEEAALDRVQDFYYFLAAIAANNCEKKAVIKSAASAASTRGGCASGRLDHSLKFHVIRGGCASSQLISESSDSGESPDQTILRRSWCLGAWKLVFG